MESNSAVPEVNVCSAAMRLMLQILNWDFQHNKNAKGGKNGIDVYSAEVRYEGARRSDCVLVQVKMERTYEKLWQSAYALHHSPILLFSPQLVKENFEILDSSVISTLYRTVHLLSQLSLTIEIVLSIMSDSL